MNNSGTLVDRRLEAGHGEKVAIRCAGESVTYAQLHDRICRVGNVLEGLGVGREDRVLMVLDDSPTFAALFLGAMRAGAVPAPVSFLDTTENFAHYARDSYAKLIVAENALLERLPEGTMARSRFESLLAEAPGERSPADTHRDDMAFWLFSGGSTGFPKGVVHLHHDIECTCETYAKEILRIREDDVTFSSTKLYHAYGLGNNLTFPYWVGATTVLRPGRPDPRGLLETAAEQRPTLFFSVPTLYGAMVNLEDSFSFDLSSVRMCVSAAEPLAPEVLRRWQNCFGLDIVDGIGSTELLHIYCSNRQGDVRPGTSGKPVPGYELVLRDELGGPVADGDVGNLWVRGDSALAYYWHQHEKTKAAIHGDLFFTGDRYRVNEDGDYVYEGRADDMIKIGGLWASPIEIENALVEHPRVLEAAAVGIDADYTTRVKAFVIARGEPGDDGLVADLQAWCKQRLRRYEYPHFIEFVDDLPKTPTGKIQRYKLRA
ncbi:benzoate-CoA ligase family protein [Solirubrobacter phytolaccae]|uniref:Benzoate-CoA ligase family protein n=1 Tax=Solirubrobacter phytolaccae TaxID=1404360 RepID=A0A9X3S969_9ACTN|nr:benzoate-CoA ligase family protein [Solirubrobacter phytolaccae]MDA0181176.1 benzoate-CoA ligase family protein [Solirubrobacter phytolaccae]